MAQYSCVVIDSKGKKEQLKYEAENKQELVQILLSNNYTIISVEEESIKKSFSIKDTFSKVKSRDLAIFCRQMQAMLVAGVSVLKCLDIVRLQLQNKKLKQVIVTVYEDLQKGRTFSEALKSHMDVFPSIFIHMIEAGETSGNLDLIMERLAMHFEKEYKVESKVKTAMAYPAVLSVVAVAVVVFLLIGVMPTFVGMYSESGVELPMMTKFFIGMSNFLINQWYIILVVIIAIVYVIRILMKNEKFILAFDSFKLRMPIFKSINQNVSTSRFTRTLSTLLGSGVSLLKALEIVSKVTGNKFIENKLNDVRNDVRKGIYLSTPLQRANIFPPMVYSMIKIGEDSGTLEEILDKTANFYDDEVENSVQRLTTLLEPLMIVVMAVLVGFIMLAIVMPMFDMVSVVG